MYISVYLISTHRCILYIHYVLICLWQCICFVSFCFVLSKILRFQIQTYHLIEYMVLCKILNSYPCLSFLAWKMWIIIITSSQSCCKSKINPHICYKMLCKCRELMWLLWSGHKPFYPSSNCLGSYVRNALFSLGFGLGYVGFSSWISNPESSKGPSSLFLICSEDQI